MLGKWRAPQSFDPRIGNWNWKVVQAKGGKLTHVKNLCRVPGVRSLVPAEPVPLTYDITPSRRLWRWNREVKSHGTRDKRTDDWMTVWPADWQTNKQTGDSRASAKIIRASQSQHQQTNYPRRSSRIWIWRAIVRFPFPLRGPV